MIASIIFIIIWMLVAKPTRKVFFTDDVTDKRNWVIHFMPTVALSLNEYQELESRIVTIHFKWLVWKAIIELEETNAYIT